MNHNEPVLFGGFNGHDGVEWAEQDDTEPTWGCCACHAPCAITDDVSRYGWPMSKCCSAPVYRTDDEPDADRRSAAPAAQEAVGAEPTLAELVASERERWAR